MPELPEVQALTEFLDGRARGLNVERCELAAIAALKTFDPPIEALVGRAVISFSRRGKYVCADLDRLWLVVHLARGGWVKWSETLPSARARPGRSPLALRLGFSDRSGMDITEMGTEKRLAIWVVRDPSDIEGIRTLGPDPLDPAFDVRALEGALATASGTIKNALVKQSVIAGVGNAYSDEALHVAKLSPFKPAAKLDAEEVARLHSALVGVMREASERIRGMTAGELKGDKKRSMRVHGRTGEACPVCGDVIREVSYSTKSLQYCATCQTGGKALADRRLSRLLK
ncbi:MAG TPA: DNA-formamidopyrimidine glycosylase family protein [Acidimicrobiales bacterium]|nr:DNA-formamidopyrimidine glycosylase family protein [Acidimicrobiales bacterium]